MPQEIGGSNPLDGLQIESPLDMSEGAFSYPLGYGFFFGNTELSLELWTVIAGRSGFDG